MLLLDRNSGRNVFQHETNPDIYLFMSNRGHWQIGKEWEVRAVEMYLLRYYLLLYIIRSKVTQISVAFDNKTGLR